MAGHMMRVARPSFRLVTANTPHGLEVAVNEQIKSGYEPFGALSIDHNGIGPAYLQWVCGYGPLPELPAESPIVHAAQLRPDMTARMNEILDRANTEKRELTQAEILAVNAMLVEICRSVPTETGCA